MARKRRRASLGVLFWVAFILFVLVVFMVNRPRIQTVLDNTGFVEIITQRFAGDSQEEETQEEETPELEWETSPQQDERQEEQPGRQPPEPESEDIPPQHRGDDGDPPEPPAEPDADAADDPGVGEDAVEAPEPTRESPEAEEAEPESAGEQPVRTLERRLYYVRVTDDGAFPEAVTRTIEYRETPLTKTINVLLAGPTSDEVAKGLLNLIPDGTRLRSAAVRNGVAYLDFNEAFRFNPMGVEGYRLQLKQIIYATTQFSTVDRVQFLIDGERHEWLGGEGVYIGSPLGRNSFS